MRILLLFIIFLIATPLRAQVLVIGTSPLNPPFAMIADREEHFFGFDIDIMLEICKRLEFSCKFTPVNYNELFPQVMSGRIGVAISAIIITSERKKNALFSLPYLESYARFMTLQKSTINNTNEVAGHVVGTRKGTPFLNFAQTMYQNNLKVKEYATIANLMEALNNHAVDVILLDNEAAEYWFANNSNDYKLIGNPLPVGYGYAIMTNPVQTLLISRINQALMNMEADGTYLKIYNQYF